MAPSSVSSSSPPLPSSPVSAGTNNTSTPSSLSEFSDADNAVDFLQTCHTLKTRKGTKRWLPGDVKYPETIADHMHGMTLMALIAPDVPGLDRNKCIKMAIIHDTAEVMIMDTCGNIQGEMKNRQRGQQALSNMCGGLGEGEGSRANEITELWKDYEANFSPEAKFVKDLEKVEYILQAVEDEKNDNGEDLKKNLSSTTGEFQTEIGKAWAEIIVSRKEKYQNLLSLLRSS